MLKRVSELSSAGTKKPRGDLVWASRLPGTKPPQRCHHLVSSDGCGGDEEEEAAGGPRGAEGPLGTGGPDGAGGLVGGAREAEGGEEE